MEIYLGGVGDLLAAGTAEPCPDPSRPNEQGCVLGPGSLRAAVDDPGMASLDPQGLDANATYYWSVANSNALGTTRSPIWSFTTITGDPPEAPVLVSPANQFLGTDRNLLFEWENGAGAGDPLHDINFSVLLLVSTELAAVEQQREEAVIFATDDVEVRAAFPDEPLEPSATYFWTVVSWNAFGGTAAQEIRSFVTGDEASDVLPPQLVESTPEDGARAIPADLEGVALSFSEEVVGVDVPGAVEVSGGVGGSVSGAGREWFFAFEGPLAAGTEHVITLGAGITDLAGNPLEPTELRFRTAAEGESTIPAKAEVIQPEDGADEVQYVGVVLRWQNGEGTGVPDVHPERWNVNVLVSAEKEALLERRDEAYLLTTDDLLSELALEPLEPSTTYYWQVLSYNVHGGAASDIWSFTTAASEDTGQPRLAFSYPAAGTTEVPTELPSVQLTFSEPVFRVADPGAVTLYPDPGFAITGAGLDWKLELHGPLTADTTYVLTLTEAIRDGSGNQLALTVVGFSTGAEVAGPPDPPSSPTPQDGAEEVDPNEDMSWTNGARTGLGGGFAQAGSGGIEPVEVFWSQERGAVEGFGDSAFIGSGPPGAEAFNPRAVGLPVKPATTYFWRVRNANRFGWTPGPVWTYTTGDFKVPPGVEASTPEQGATGVPLDLPAVEIVFTKDVLGLELAGAVVVTPELAGSFSGEGTHWRLELAEQLTADTTYTVELNELVTDLDGEPLVPFVLVFSTGEAVEGSPPGESYNPEPADGATDLLFETAVLRWTNGEGTGFPFPHQEHYNVSLWLSDSEDAIIEGRAEALCLVTDEVVGFFDPNAEGSLCPPLKASTTYYWAVDNANMFGPAYGLIWSFTTATPCEPACDGKECGPDGCGDTCGECDDQNPCTDDKCDAAQRCEQIFNLRP